VTLTVVRRSRLYDLDTFARAAGAHPDLVRRLVALGLLEPERDAAGELWFTPAQLITLATPNAPGPDALRARNRFPQRNGEPTCC